jgi:hypothetical protein
VCCCCCCCCCRPDVALQLGWAITREVIEQKILGKEDKYQLKA